MSKVSVVGGREGRAKWQVLISTTIFRLDAKDVKPLTDEERESS